MSNRVRAGTIALAAAMLLLAACGKTAQVRDNELGGIQIAAPKNKARIEGNVVSLDVRAPKGVKIVKADGDTSGKTGHWHVFVDREPLEKGETIPKGPGIIHAATSPVVIPGLAPGEHKIAVVLGDGAHARLSDDVARTTVFVDGPAVDASAPAAATAGQALKVTVKVYGFKLARPPAPGGASPAASPTAHGSESPAGHGSASPGHGKAKDELSGHLHALIDHEPVPGASMPKDATTIHFATPVVEIPNLAPGDHTIWIVAGDAKHIPFDPPVMDRITVTVT